MLYDFTLRGVLCYFEVARSYSFGTVVTEYTEAERKKLDVPMAVDQPCVSLSVAAVNSWAAPQSTASENFNKLYNDFIDVLKHRIERAAQRLTQQQGVDAARAMQPLLYLTKSQRGFRGGLSDRYHAQFNRLVNAARAGGVIESAPVEIQGTRGDGRVFMPTLQFICETLKELGR